ncbi:MAG: Fe-S protein assembly co-chaperone HscB [Alphaproteobacteria bacterium]|nr:Fe-S protein assembly co-chaperone HscB [Alphaproteobacteria bacterium]
MLNPILETGVIDIETIRPQATPFALLGLEPTFDIDQKKMEYHYFCLQRELHPDRFANKTAHEANSARMMSAWVNNAYSKLKDPILRAESLLRITGVKVGGENDASVQDPILLNEVMEWREELAEIHSLQLLEDFHKKFKEMLESTGEHFSISWKNKDIAAMQKFYLKMIYVSKIIEEAKEHKRNY